MAGSPRGTGQHGPQQASPHEVFLPRGPSPGWRMAPTFWDPNATPAWEMPGPHSIAKNVAAARRAVHQLTSHASPFSLSLLLLSTCHLEPNHIDVFIMLFFFFAFLKNNF